MLISIDFDRTCDLPGIGVRTPYPPPPPSGSLDPHIHDIYRLKNKVEKGRIGSPGRREHLRFSHFKVTGKPIFSRTKRIKNEICIPRMHI